jgi:hypothetical protein
LNQNPNKVTIFIKNATFLEQMLGNSAVQMNNFLRLTFSCLAGNAGPS